MDYMRGQWYIQPETRRLVDIDNLAPELLQQINLSDVLEPGSMTVGGVNSSSDQSGGDPSPGVRWDITDRLAEANPVTNDWFFSSDSL